MTCEATWHRLEHSGYTADLEVWRSLAREFGPTVCEVGAGCGRVTASLAASGFVVTGIDIRRSYTNALRAATPPGSRISTVCGDPMDDAGLIPDGTGLILFPLLVAELICGEHGKAEGLTMIAKSVPFTSAVALAISGRHYEKSGMREFPPPIISKPYSYVASVETSADWLRLTHARVSSTSETQVSETLVPLTAADLETAFNRPAFDLKEIPSAEGVGNSQVVVFDAK